MKAKAIAVLNQKGEAGKTTSRCNWVTQPQSLGSGFQSTGNSHLLRSSAINEVEMLIEKVFKLSYDKKTPVNN